MDDKIETNEEGLQPEAGVDQVKVYVGVADDRVVLQFDNEIAWLRLTPVQADQLAAMLQQKAQEAAAQINQGAS